MVPEQGGPKILCRLPKLVLYSSPLYITFFPASEYDPPNGDGFCSANPPGGLNIPEK